MQAQHPVEAKRKLKSTFGAHVIAPDSRPTESTHAADNCRVAADSLSPKHTVPAPAHTPAAKHTTEQLLTNRLLAPLCAYFSSTQPDTAHTRQLACHVANTNQTFSRARMMSLPTVHKHSAHLCEHNTTHTQTSQDALHEHVQGSMPDKASFASRYQATLPPQPQLATPATATSSACIALNIQPLLHTSQTLGKTSEASSRPLKNTACFTHTSINTIDAAIRLPHTLQHRRGLSSNHHDAKGFKHRRLLHITLGLWEHHNSKQSQL